MNGHHSVTKDVHNDSHFLGSTERLGEGIHPRGYPDHLAWSTPKPTPMVSPNLAVLSIFACSVISKLDITHKYQYKHMGKTSSSTWHFVHCQVLAQDWMTYFVYCKCYYWIASTQIHAHTKRCISAYNPLINFRHALWVKHITWYRIGWQLSGDTRHPIWYLSSDFIDEGKARKEVTFSGFNFSNLQV